jgi:hypothetical protein
MAVVATSLRVRPQGKVGHTMEDHLADFHTRPEQLWPELAGIVQFKGEDTAMPAWGRSNQPSDAQGLHVRGMI